MQKKQHLLKASQQLKEESVHVTTATYTEKEIVHTKEIAKKEQPQRNVTWAPTASYTPNVLPMGTAQAHFQTLLIRIGTLTNKR